MDVVISYFWSGRRRWLCPFKVAVTIASLAAVPCGARGDLVPSATPTATATLAPTALPTLHTQQIVSMPVPVASSQTSLLRVGYRLFALTQTPQTWLVRYNNLDDLTDATPLQFPNDGLHAYGAALAYVSGRVYVLFQHTPCTFSAVDPDTLAFSDYIDSAVG